MFLIHFSYAIPVLLVSLALSVPKFLETRFVWTPVNSNTSGELEGGSTNETSEWMVSLGVSDLRSDPDYIRYTLVFEVARVSHINLVIQN